MGLDASIRKLSKSKARAWGLPDPLLPVTMEIRRIPSYWRESNELAYWRGQRELNHWMMKLAHSRVDPDKCLDIDYDIMNGACIILRNEDVLALKMEAMFGDLFGDPASYFVETTIADLDRILRVVRCNRSYVYYQASW